MSNTKIYFLFGLYIPFYYISIRSTRLRPSAFIINLSRRVSNDIPFSKLFYINNKREKSIIERNRIKKKLYLSNYIVFTDEFDTLIKRIKSPFIL